MIIDQIQEITDVPIILTNRTVREGGFFRGSEEKRTAILRDNANLVEYIDIELSTEPELRDQVIENANNTIISYHNFEYTPSFDDLQDIVDESLEIGDIAKVALKPLEIDDTYILLRLIMNNENLIGISMDELGSYTRVVGPLIGSPITYASIENESAPGQLDVETTRCMIKTLNPRYNDD